MAIEPVFESFNIVKSGGKVETTVRAECKTEISTDGIDKIIGVFAVASITEKETEVGKIKCGGKIVYQVFYEKDGEIGKCESFCEYAGTIDDQKILEDTVSRLEVNVEKAEADITGAKLIFSAVLTIKGELYFKEALSALSGGENLILQNKETTVTKSFGIKSGTYSIEEEFEIPYEIKEVLMHNAKPRVTAAQCGVGTIIVDGEVLLSALLLPNSENGDIIREEKALPFRMELDYDEAMPSMNCTANVNIKNFKTDISVEEGGGKSLVTASVNMQFESEATADEDITFAEDVFSSSDELEVTTETVLYDVPHSVIGCTCALTERVSPTVLPIGARINAVGNEKAEITSVTAMENGLKLEGVLSVDLYVKDIDGKISIIKAETPFVSEAACVVPDDAAFSVKHVLSDVKARIVSAEEIEVSAELLLSVYTGKSKELKYIKSVTAVGEKTLEKSAISVYIPTEGEELWSLAKRLNVAPESILVANKELQFPLTGEERIVVYRQE